MVTWSDLWSYPLHMWSLCGFLMAHNLLSPRCYNSMIHGVEIPSMGVSHLHCLRWGIQEDFRHNLLGCGCIWFTSLMGQPLFAFELNLRLLCPQRLPVSGRGYSTNRIFSLISRNTIWRIPPTSARNFETWMEFVQHLSIKLELSRNHGFLPPFLVLWGMIKANTAVVSQCSHKHAWRWWELYGYGDVLVTAAAHAMQGIQYATISDKTIQ